MCKDCEVAQAVSTPVGWPTEKTDRFVPEYRLTIEFTATEDVAVLTDVLTKLTNLGIESNLKLRKQILERW